MSPPSNGTLELLEEALILGAWGCGAFGNQPASIARLFREELEPFLGTFERVVFAVFTAKQGDAGNLTAFQEAFADLIDK